MNTRVETKNEVPEKVAEIFEFICNLSSYERQMVIDTLSFFHEPVDLSNVKKHVFRTAFESPEGIEAMRKFAAELYEEHLDAGGIGGPTIYDMMREEMINSGRLTEDGDVKGPNIYEEPGIVVINDYAYGPKIGEYMTLSKKAPSLKGDEFIANESARKAIYDTLTEDEKSTVRKLLVRSEF